MKKFSVEDFLSKNRGSFVRRIFNDEHKVIGFLCRAFKEDETTGERFPVIYFQSNSLAKGDFLNSVPAAHLIFDRTCRMDGLKEMAMKKLQHLLSKKQSELFDGGFLRSSKLYFMSDSVSQGSDRYSEDCFKQLYSFVQEMEGKVFSCGYSESDMDNLNFKDLAEQLSFEIWRSAKYLGDNSGKPVKFLFLSNDPSCYCSQLQ